MNIKATLALLAALCFATPAFGQLKPYTDYDTADAISSVSTIKVDANMIDYYLEGIRGTWVASNEAALKLGHIKSYSVYVSELPLSGDFNVLLVTRFNNASQMEPSKARYDAFMKAWGDANDKNTRETVKTYPGIRTITGEYRLREITFK